ncbi:hypothetical protein UlMin_044153 [Ulmus minor]
MLCHTWSIYRGCVFSPSQTSWPSGSPISHHNLVLNKPFCSRKPRTPTATRIRAQLLDEITQIVHNKVLIAAGVSAAIGQFSKPFTSVILYGKDFDVKAVVQAGGFPSTHSSAVIATATCLGLERGFSDSIFGMSVVYAGLIMYDAQGVRREVGIHARTLNKALQAKQPRVNSVPAKDRDGFDPQTSKSSFLNYKETKSSTSKSANAVLVSESEKKTRQTSSTGGNAEEQQEQERSGAEFYIPLKESIGHTEVEVIAGALLGFLVSLAVNNIL